MKGRATRPAFVPALANGHEPRVNSVVALCAQALPDNSRSNVASQVELVDLTGFVVVLCVLKVKFFLVFVSMQCKSKDDMILIDRVFEDF